MLKTKPIIHKKSWEKFLNKTYQGNFPLFQTWQWGDVQKNLGFEVERLGLYRGEILLGIAQIVFVKARRGYYLHLRQGPVVIGNTSKNLLFFLKEIISIAKKIQVDFIRISLMQEKNSTMIAFPSPAIASPIHNMDAEICWILDITKPEDEILKAMRKSHRYLIKKAAQLPIRIVKSTSQEAFEKFLPLDNQLAQKRHFVPHHGIAQELEIFSKDNLCVLFLAEFDGKIIAGALIDFVGDMAIYRHSASMEAYRHIPAMYLLQWEVIKEAKKRGKKVYNFWGIAENEQKNHPWYGLTLFKTGFGGEKKEFMHARDIPLRLGYVKTYIIDYVTKIRKGY